MASDDRRSFLIEQLARLAHDYRHFQQEHDREAAGSATRRTLAAKMQRVEERFEQLLSHWVDDEALRRDWITHLHDGGPPPDEPKIATPPLFVGVTDAGTRVEIRAAGDGAYDVIVDGTIESHEAVPWYLDPDLIEPIRIGQHSCREIYAAPPEAQRALAAFLSTSGAEPPWGWARALFEDGLIDENFGLTPRGYRRLGKASRQRLAAPTAITFGILAADAARARVFVLRTADGDTIPTISPLVEVFQTTHPDQRTRDSELLADTRPGLRREAPQGPRHAVGDHRERRRQAAEQRFAAEVVADAMRIWREHGVTRAVVVASPAMLGALRPAIAHASGGAMPWSHRELARDLTRLAPPALHDVLAAAGLLPPRGRLPPLYPTPGAPT